MFDLFVFWNLGVVCLVFIWLYATQCFLSTVRNFCVFIFGALIVFAALAAHLLTVCCFMRFLFFYGNFECGTALRVHPAVTRLTVYRRPYVFEICKFILLS